jgi:hypothetical protein
MLSGGDRRSIGKVADVVVLIDQHPQWIYSLVGGLWDEDACVRMRGGRCIGENFPRTVSPSKEQMLGRGQQSRYFAAKSV